MASLKALLPQESNTSRGVSLGRNILSRYKIDEPFVLDHTKRLDLWL